MLSSIEILILSVIQGLTEFLPVSSAAHLILVAKYYSFNNQNLLIDISLHFGSLLAILFYFRKDLINFASNKNFLVKIIIGTIPIVPIGYFFYETGFIDQLRSLKVIGWMSLIFGIFLYLSDKKKIENEKSLDDRLEATSIYGQLSKTAEKFGNKDALSFQLKSGPNDPAETLSWSQLREEVTKTSNALRGLGINETDVVAYVLPNCTEAIVTFLAGSTTGIVCPISPLLSPEQMAGILNEVKAKAVISLRSFPKTDVAQRVDEALSMASEVKTLIEIDLLRYLKPPLTWIVGLIRPKLTRSHSAVVFSFEEFVSDHSSTKLSFEVSKDDRIAGCFHT